MENISKMIVSKSTGDVVGYILNIVLDNFVKIGYVIVDEESEGEYFLGLQNILAASDKFVVIDDEQALDFLPQNDLEILGKEVLDFDGFSYGQVVSLNFCKNKCLKIITKNCEILTKFIKNIGKNVIFVDFKRNKKNFLKNKFLKTSTNLNMIDEIKIQKISSPEKVSLSTKTYIGKVCLEDILGYNNERIVSRGSVITKEIVEKAKKHNKLNQLFFALERN